jgi:ubiquinone/menaquinone biosynthesis C-methylase UbiE
MIRNPYKGISSEISDAMQSLISKEDGYHVGHSRRMARTIAVLLNEKPEGKLLELGTSHLVPLVLEQTAPDLEVHVTDFQMDLERKGKMNVQLGAASRECPVYRLDLETETIPVADETFDYVICSEVLEHMEVDPMFMLCEVNRVLKTGGTLLLTTPNIASSWGITKILRGIEPYFYMQYRHKPALYRHNYEYTVHSAMALIQGAGFDGQIWTEDSFEEPNTPEMNRLEKAGYLMKHTGDNIFVLAKKVGPVVNRHPSQVYAD